MLGTILSFVKTYFFVSTEVFYAEIKKHIKTDGQ